MAEAIEILGKVRIGGRNAGNFFDDAFAVATRRQHGRRHGDTVITTRRNASRLQQRLRGNGESVTGFADPCPEA